MEKKKIEFKLPYGSEWNGKQSGVTHEGIATNLGELSVHFVTSKKSFFITFLKGGASKRSKGHISSYWGELIG